MTDDPYRQGRRDDPDVPPTKPMIDRQPQSSNWMAVALVAAVLVAVGYYFLQPDLPSPVMRAEPPSTAAPSSK